MNKKLVKIVRIVILVILALAVALSLMVPITAAFAASSASDASGTSGTSSASGTDAPQKETRKATPAADVTSAPVTQGTADATGAPDITGAVNTTTTIATLNAAGSVIDGQQVVFTGEVVGDIVASSDGAHWVTFYDNGQTISVLLADEQTALITNLGRYAMRGTTLEIAGTYHLACDKHDGLSDVHASKAVVIDTGEPTSHQPNWQFAAIGAALVVLGALLLLAQRYMRNRAR